MSKFKDLEILNLCTAIESGLHEMGNGEISVDAYRKAFADKMYQRRQEYALAIAEAKEELYKMRNEYSCARYRTGNAYIAGIEAHLESIVRP